MKLHEIQDQQTIELRIFRCEGDFSISYDASEYETVRRRVRVHRCRVSPGCGALISRPVPAESIRVPVVRFEGETFRVKYDHLDDFFFLMLPKV